VNRAKIDRIVSRLAFDTADFPLHGRCVIALGEDDLLLFEHSALTMSWHPTLEAIRLYIDFAVDFKSVGFLTGARLFVCHLLLGRDTPWPFELYGHEILIVMCAHIGQTSIPACLACFLSYFLEHVSFESLHKRFNADLRACRLAIYSVRFCELELIGDSDSLDALIDERYRSHSR
jgi:hypothetical protein